MSDEGRRLYRSRTDRMLAGVCGGLAEYFDLDTVLVRVIFVIMALLQGVGIIAYIVLLIVVPERPATATSVTGEIQDESGTPSTGPADRRGYGGGPDHARSRQRQRGMAGIILILLGALFLLGNLGLLWWLNFNLLWPLILVAIGLALLIRNWR